MSRPEMKADESHVSYVPTASPFDAYSFPVSSPSEADLEPVAPPPQEAADGAEVCEAKSFLQQLLAGRTTTPNSASPRREDSDGIWSPLTTGLISSGLGLLVANWTMRPGTPSLLALEDILPQVPLQLRDSFTIAYTAALQAELMIKELRRASLSGEFATLYQLAAQQVASSYGTSLEVLLEMSRENPTDLLGVHSPHPFQLYLISLQGSARASLFDLRSPDSLELTTDNRDNLSSFRNQFARLLESKEVVPFMTDFDIYEFSRMQAAIEMKLGFFSNAAAHAKRATDHLKLAVDKAGGKSPQYSFPGLENVLQLWLEALRQDPNEDGAAQLRKYFEDLGRFDQAARVTVMMIAALQEKNVSSGTPFPSDEIPRELVKLAQLITKLKPSDREPQMAAILNELLWLKQRKGVFFSATTAGEIAKVFEENGDFRNAAILWSQSAWELSGTPFSRTASNAHNEAFALLERAVAESIAEGGKTQGAGAAAEPPPQPAIPEGVSRESIAKDLRDHLKGLSELRKEAIVNAVAAAVGRKGSISGIIEDGHLTSRGMLFVFKELGVTTSGTAGPSSVARAKGLGEEKKDGRKPGGDVVKGGEHGRP